MLFFGEKELLDVTCTAEFNYRKVDSLSLEMYERGRRVGCGWGWGCCVGLVCVRQIWALRW